MPTIVEQILSRIGLPMLFRNMGEPVDYFSKADGLTHQLTAVVAPATGMLSDSNSQTVTTEEVHVRIGRTASATFGGVLVGGICQPMLDDTIVRTSKPDRRPYFYGGPVKSDGNTWVLIFRRQAVEQVGTGNQLRR
ncbi:MAG TPA: hypothetical protein VGG64_12680 [Pirellulales bacterium]